MNRSIAAASVDYERQERLDQITIQETLLQASRNRINNEADLTIRNIEKKEQASDVPCQKQQTCPEVHFPSKSLQFNELTQEYSPTHLPSITQPRRQTLLETGPHTVHNYAEEQFNVQTRADVHCDHTNLEENNPRTSATRWSEESCPNNERQIQSNM